MRIVNKTKTSVDYGKQAGRIKLSVRGFNQQNIVPISKIISAIDKLPSHHIAGLKEICYDPQRQTLNLLQKSDPLAESPQTKGMYLQGYRTIAIYDFKDEKQLFTVLFHELGHYVFYTVINTTIKKHWVTQIHKSKPFLNSYAERNASEDFAECYAEYLLNPVNLNRNKKKYNFINNCVFSSNIYNSR